MADPKKPYGDVAYADPGYQSDGVKRYPLDTEAHCRAAWSYINQAKNAAKYSADEVAKIKARIKAAGKKYGIDFEEGSEHAADPVDAAAVVKFDRFDSPVADASFRVNVPERTITGLAVPWDDVASSAGRKYRFERGSLRWDESRRVRLLRDHDDDQFVGRSVRFEDTAEGLVGTFKVRRGPEGDQTLWDAQDGIVDGLSVGVHFTVPPGPDPMDRSVNFIRAAEPADLTETSLVFDPAFNTARVRDVAASQKGTSSMSTTVDDKPDAQGAEFQLEPFLTSLAEQTTAAHVRLASELTESIGESFAAGIKTALEGISDPQDQGPQRVRAARFQVVREPPVYSLNMAHPGPSLVRDAYYAATTQDQDAKERLRKYRVQTEEVAKIAQLKLSAQILSASFATSTTVTDPEVIPPGYRPDLYVPQLAQERPLVSSASHGTISNATPFVVPVFTSITGGSADHVEGTNPTDGTLAFASKTVSPLGISGLLKLTREIVDSSNPAIDQIALQAMRESYSQQTEGKVYTLLNGTSGAGGTITGDFVPSGAQASTTAGGTDQQTLVKHLRERLAKYPFNRFASPTRGHLGQGATVRLATAVDTTQRPLFPSIGASNAAGVGNSMTQGWNIDGLPFIPTWAMTGTAAGDSQILFLNSTDLWVWESPLLSFRYEERSGPALIELAMFGYFGTHLLRPVGLSGIRIT